MECLLFIYKRNKLFTEQTKRPFSHFFSPAIALQHTRTAPEPCQRMKPLDFGICFPGFFYCAAPEIVKRDALCLARKSGKRICKLFRTCGIDAFLDESYCLFVLCYSPRIFSISLIKYYSIPNTTVSTFFPSVFL